MDKSEANISTLELCAAIRQIFAAEELKGTSAASTINRVLNLLPEIHQDPGGAKAVELPVCRHLSRCLELGNIGSAEPVARAIRSLVPTLAWAQSSRHNLKTRSVEFMDNYAYSSLGLTGSKILDIGILLLGPGITYPVTSYPSEGIFLVIGGSPEWKSGSGPWRRVASGDIIHRPRNGAEGKRPGREPLLALYAWLSE